MRARYRAWLLPFALLGIAGCGSSEPGRATFARKIDWIGRGLWLKGDLHAQSRFGEGLYPLETIVAKAAANDCDVLAVTENARGDRQAGSTEYAAAMELARRTHPRVLLLSGLEWNIPGQPEEQAVVLFPQGDDEWARLAEFKLRFDGLSENAKDPLLLDAAIRFLSRDRDRSKNPIVYLAHPKSAGRTDESIVSGVEQWLTAGAPLVGLEGAPGRQGARPIGDYRAGHETVDRWDPAVAVAGGAWDRLLGKGVDLWGAFASSDFRNDAAVDARDYWPGEFAETWIYAADRSPAAVLRAIEAGAFFGVHGKIAREVVLSVNAPGLDRPAQAGEAIEVTGTMPVEASVEFLLPAEDWRGQPNRIDLVELIGATPRGGEVLLSRMPAASGAALRATLHVPPGGITLRARGRRSVPDGPDLLFYTNPVRVGVRPPRGPIFSFLATMLSLGRELPVLLAVAVGIGSIALLGFFAYRHRRSLAERGWRILEALGPDDVRRPPRQPDSDIVLDVAYHAVDSTEGAPPRRRHFAAAAAIFIALAVYGSLVPLKFQPLSFDEAVRRFKEIPFLELGIASRADWVANLLLFLPIGFLLSASFLVDARRRGAAFLAAPLILALSMLLGVGIEFVQLWFPHRTVSQNDVIAQAVGAFLGCLFWLVGGRRLARWLREYFANSAPARQLDWLLRAYAAGLVLYSMMPLDLTLSPGELSQKYREGKVLLTPFRHGSAAPLSAAYDVLVGGALFVPIGMLLSTVLLPAGSAPRPAWQAALLGLPCALAIEAGQLFVYSRFTDATDVVSGTIGAAVGGGIMGRLREGGARAAAVPAWVYLSLALIYALFLAGVFWQPFDWVIERPFAEPRFQAFFRTPLAAMYAGSDFNAVTQLLRKTLFFAPLGALFAFSLKNVQGPARWLLRGVLLAAAFALAMGIELAQVFLPSHTPDLTDAMLCFLGAAGGMGVATRLVGAAAPVESTDRARTPAPEGVIYLAPTRPEDVAPMPRRQAPKRPRRRYPSRGFTPETRLLLARIWSGLGDWRFSATVAAALGGAMLFLVARSLFRSDVRLPDELRDQVLIGDAERTGSVFLAAPADPFAPPRAESVAVPPFFGATAIWGAIGRDHRGAVWTAASASGTPIPSAHLFEYLSGVRQLIPRGDVVSELQRLGVYRLGEGQSTISSRLVEGADGHLYFASHDDRGENPKLGIPPTWGSYFWRLRMPERRWEKLFSAREALHAVASGGRKMYALGYYDHVLYQFDPRTADVRSVTLGSKEGHFTRQFFTDLRGHVYVPCVSDGAQNRPRIELVELGAELDELARTPIENYHEGAIGDAYGIVAFVYLADRSIVFSTELGYLYRVEPTGDGPAAVDPLGWLHPGGKAFASALFTLDGRRYLAGVTATAKYASPSEWVVLDLATAQRKASPLTVDRLPASAWRDLKLYGSMTRDDVGGFYLGGWQRGGPEESSAAGRSDRHRPIFVRLAPGG